MDKHKVICRVHILESCHGFFHDCFFCSTDFVELGESCSACDDSRVWSSSILGLCRDHSG
jgi:hypothetical protein